MMELRSHRARHARPYERSYFTPIRRTSKIIDPKMQIGRLTLQQLDDFLSHIIENIDKELQPLMSSKKRGSKTLSVRDLDTAVKLSLPVGVGGLARKFGDQALEVYFKNTKMKSI